MGYSAHLVRFGVSPSFQSSPSFADLPSLTCFLLFLYSVRFFSILFACINLRSNFDRVANKRKKIRERIRKCTKFGEIWKYSEILACIRYRSVLEHFTYVRYFKLKRVFAFWIIQRNFPNLSTYFPVSSFVRTTSRTIKQNLFYRIVYVSSITQPNSLLAKWIKGEMKISLTKWKISKPSKKFKRFCKGSSHYVHLCRWVSSKEIRNTRLND